MEKVLYWWRIGPGSSIWSILSLLTAFRTLFQFPDDRRTASPQWNQYVYSTRPGYVFRLVPNLDIERRSAIDISDMTWPYLWGRCGVNDCEIQYSAAVARRDIDVTLMATGEPYTMPRMAASVTGSSAFPTKPCWLTGLAPLPIRIRTWYWRTMTLVYIVW